ncbi:MAG: hypothetical protein P8R54_13650 [Myxococcota bacterium]|nr:hypothetical protein [Myxococcota bacterium]
MEERTWWIYQCREPDCGTVIYIGAREGQVPEPRRVCQDCDGVSELQNPETLLRKKVRYEG